MPADTDSDVLRLQGALRDLVALSAIPAAWIGREPAAIAAGLADALVALLALDFAFVRLCGPDGARRVDVTRGSTWERFPDWLERHGNAAGQFSGGAVVVDVDVDDRSAPCRGIAMPIGVGGSSGLVAAAARRREFPTATEQVLLSLAANQAAMAFQNAHLIDDLRRAEKEARTTRDKLEVKVTERTVELQQANDELRALRRMATLVAQGVAPAEIFSAVCEEVGRLLGSEAVVVVRFEYNPPAVVVVGLGHSIPGVTTGTRQELDDTLASTTVRRTGRPARVDSRDSTSARGPIHEPAFRQGLTSTVACPIIVEGRLWGTMSVSAQEPLPPDTEDRLEKFTELVATAIANADGKSELAASRRRIVAASDAARRRIERDLHDGTQQRLVTLGLAVRATEADVEPDDHDLRSELARIAAGLDDAVTELRELSRGIHPAILSQGGLGPALRTLARRSSFPVDLDITTDTRLPEPIEVAVYYVASEALANAVKHAQASRVEVSLAARDANLLLSVRDDGVGGADPAHGSGLVGLTDRVEALGGSILVHSPPGEGTRVSVELPLELEMDTYAE